MPRITLDSGEFEGSLGSLLARGVQNKTSCNYSYITRQLYMFPSAGKTALVFLAITKRIFYLFL